METLCANQLILTESNKASDKMRSFSNLAVFHVVLLLALETEENGAKSAILGGCESLSRPFFVELAGLDCGGTVIGTRHVLTAAHCLQDTTGEHPIFSIFHTHSERVNLIADNSPIKVEFRDFTDPKSKKAHNSATKVHLHEG